MLNARRASCAAHAQALSSSTRKGQNRGMADSCIHDDALCRCGSRGRSFGKPGNGLCVLLRRLFLLQALQAPPITCLILWQRSLFAVDVDAEYEQIADNISNQGLNDLGILQKKKKKKKKKEKKKHTYNNLFQLSKSSSFSRSHASLYVSCVRGRAPHPSSSHCSSI